VWVKICGTTCVEDACLAAEAGADAVGFVFAESPRRVTVEAARSMAARLPAATEKIGVFVEPGFEAVARAVEEAALTGVQMYGGFPMALLRERFPALRLLRVVHFSEDLEAGLRAAAGEPAVDAVLVDSRAGSRMGGTGIPFDWARARGHFEASERRLVAAGGLAPANVAAAIAALAPWGVDVVTGVEAAPGRKDPARVRDFVALARRAAKAG
jgi:phosphoribosylanthranilate isomerase